MIKRTFRDALEAQGITIVWFAHEMGINPSTIRGWDKQRAVTFGTAPRWAWLILETWKRFPEVYAWQKSKSTYTSRSRRAKRGRRPMEHGLELSA